MPRARRTLCIACILLAGAGCAHNRVPPGGSTTRPSPGGLTLHGELSDPIGDALPDPSVPVSPDLVHGTVDVAAGRVTFSIQFAPGTFDPSTTRLTINLDTDRNPSTGIRQAGPLGVEYVVDMWAPTRQASIDKAVPTASCTLTDPCYVPIGSAPLSFVADGMVVTVPLSLLGNADGRLNFRVFAYAARPGAATTGPTITADSMPDITLPPGHVP